MKTMMLFKLVSHFGGLLYGREMQVFFSGTNGNSVTNLYTKNNMWLVEKIITNFT